MAENDITLFDRLSRLKSFGLAKLSRYGKLRVMAVVLPILCGYFIIGCSGHLTLIPSDTVEKSIGDELRITVKSNMSLNQSNSHIICYYNPELNCPDKASNYETLFQSTGNKVKDGTSNRSERFRVEKRTRHDFDLIIDGVKEVDQGCYYCEEMSDDDSDKEKLNVLVNNSTKLVLIAQNATHTAIGVPNDDASNSGNLGLKIGLPISAVFIVIVIGCVVWWRQQIRNLLDNCNNRARRNDHPVDADEVNHLTASEMDSRQTASTPDSMPDQTVTDDSQLAEQKTS